MLTTLLSRMYTTVVLMCQRQAPAAQVQALAAEGGEEKHTALWRRLRGHAWPTALRGFGWCWTGVVGWGKVAPQGGPGGKASGRATEGVTSWR